MAFKPKSFQQILADMAATVSAKTPVNDFSPGSVILTLLEVAAQEDAEQNVQMIDATDAYDLDSTTGEDLAKRAFEYGLTRAQAKPHSGYVTLKDTRFSKISTKLYSGTPGPTTGSTTINIDDASNFPSSGSLYIGRGTENSEGPISYTAAPVDNTSFWTITLDTAVLNDHGTDETIILSQFGQRTFSAGLEVRVPENDYSEEILFELNQTVTLLDGENEIRNVLITALEPGGNTIPKNAIKQFVSPPFTGAEVANPSPFINGRDEETDAALRDRIRETIQSLSRGTDVSIRNGISGLIDPESNTSITSINTIKPVVVADGPTKVYIDNGRGLEPELSPYGLETLIDPATGGERFFQLTQFPLVKSNVISQFPGPFPLSGGETLTIEVGTNEETVTFSATDFDTPGSANTNEVVESINNKATIFEARTITNETGTYVIITPIADQNENMRVNPASTANVAFNFSTNEVFTSKLYKNDKLLTKDGITASVVSKAQPFSVGTVEVELAISDAIISGRVVTISGGSNNFLELVKAGDYVRLNVDSDAFYTKVRTVVDASKLILESEYPEGSLGGGTDRLMLWQSPQLEVAANGDENETELISFGPNDFSDTNAILASEVLARLDKDLNLTRPTLSLNGTQLKLTSYLENSAKSKMRVIGGAMAQALGFSDITEAYQLDITNIQANSSVVTGVGFNNLEEGQWIKASLDGNHAWTKVRTIENDTRLYLDTTYNGSTYTTSTIDVMVKGEEVVGANKDYTLNKSNGMIELNEPLVAGDSLTAGSINTRPFLTSSVAPFDVTGLGANSELVVSIDGGKHITSANSSSSQVISSDLLNFEAGLFVGYSVKCTAGANLGFSRRVATYTASTGTLQLVTPFPSAITNGDTFVLYQVLQFSHATDFIDPANISASEMVSVIKSKIKGGSAVEKLNGSIQLRSNSFIDASIRVFEETGYTSINSVLNFELTRATEQEPNIAYVLSGNSDREGLADLKGFTFAPDQSLVAVFDDDSANKSFVAPMRVKAEIASAVSGNVFSPKNFNTLYNTLNHFKDWWVYWGEGSVNEGTLQYVGGYNEVTGTLTTFDYFGTSQTPLADDVVYIVPRTAENVVQLLEDLNVSTFSTAANIETLGATGDRVQVSTKLPGTSGKVWISGGTANSVGITILGPVVGGDNNSVTVNSKAGLTKGMPILIKKDATADVQVFISDIQGTTAPYTVTLKDITGAPFVTTAYIPANNPALASVNNFNFSTTQVEGIDGYKHYTGLIQLAQWTIDGLDDNLANYPGIAASGTQFTVITPILVRLKVNMNVTPITGVSLSSISNEVSSKVLEYVNARKIGEDVVISELIAAAQSVAGVFDVNVDLTQNVVAEDGELIKLAPSDLIIG